MESNFPVVDMGLLQTEKRPEAMDKIKVACENWGFFELVNQGIGITIAKQAIKIRVPNCSDSSYIVVLLTVHEEVIERRR
uniref:Putative ovule protein n=1 Tax=Solanum chacoense TaxID=4108 RepID=A0A0V0HWH3_SOLCH